MKGFRAKGVAVALCVFAAAITAVRYNDEENARKLSAALGGPCNMALQEYVAAKELFENPTVKAEMAKDAAVRDVVGDQAILRARFLSNCLKQAGAKAPHGVTKEAERVPFYPAAPLLPLTSKKNHLTV